jgi:hypothetical protein
VRLAFVERTEDLHTVARVAGEQTIAEGELVGSAVVPFLLTLPADAGRPSRPPTRASAGSCAPAPIAPDRTRSPTIPSSCSGATLPMTGRGGRVAEGTRLLSEYGV